MTSERRRCFISTKTTRVAAMPLLSRCLWLRKISRLRSNIYENINTVILPFFIERDEPIEYDISCPTRVHVYGRTTDSDANGHQHTFAHITCTRREPSRDSLMIFTGGSTWYVTTARWCTVLLLRNYQIPNFRW